MMDAEDLINKIPPIEKILGLIWILSWVCAIWVYHMQFFLTGLFCLILIFIILNSYDKKEDKLHRPPLVFSMDKNTRTLTVQKIYDDSIRWEDNEICSGFAKLPAGEIKEGDTVTECDGNIAFRHVPTNTLLGGFNFKRTEK